MLPTPLCGIFKYHLGTKTKGLYSHLGLEKIYNIQDFRKFAFGYTNEAGPPAQHLEGTQPNVYLLQQTRQSSTKATLIMQ